MKIGVLTHNYPRFAGDFSGSFVEALCREYVRQGAEVTVVAPFDPAYRRAAADLGGVRLHTYRYVWPDSAHRLGYMRTMRADLAMKGEAYLLGALLLTLGKAAVERWIAQAQPDVLHAHWVLPNGYLAAGAAARRGIPLVVSIPG
ncbi:MAG: glycosyltransferase, partial [Anaerolineae bacterium]